MEILDMTFGGIPVWVWLVGIWVVWVAQRMIEEIREQRATRRELDANMKRFKEEHEWKPKMVGGVDCGEWVRKDGRPIEYD